MKRILLSLCLLTMSLAAIAQTTRYVKAVASGNSSGSSWANASGDLQLMINSSANYDQVWVAAGTFKPNRRADALTSITLNDRYNAFVLKADVKIYGGFAGNEATFAERNLTLTANKSTFSGDIGTVSVIADNAYHVVIAAGAVGAAELNGFTISGGNADGQSSVIVNGLLVYTFYGGGMYNFSSSPSLTNITISGNVAVYSGGGMFNYYESSPILTKVTISGNTSESGGGMGNFSSSPILTNVTLNGNTAISGGGMYNFSSNPVLTNATISGNAATYGGGGMYNFSSSPILTNATISGNKDNNYGGAMFNEISSNPKVKNSIVYNNSSGIVNLDSPAPEYEYSLVQDNPNGTAMMSYTGAANAIFVSPQPPGLHTGGDYMPLDKRPTFQASLPTWRATYVYKRAQ
jgi:hypothetical protein